MLSIDIMGTLPRSPERHEYLLVVVDYFTRRVEYCGIQTQTKGLDEEFPSVKCEGQIHSKARQMWKGPYRVVKQLGPLNYQVVLEDTGQDVRTMHVCNHKLFYPSAEDLDLIDRKRVLDILQESSKEEDFLGFLD